MTAKEFIKKDIEYRFGTDTTILNTYYSGERWLELMELYHLEKSKAEEDMSFKDELTKEELEKLIDEGLTPDERKLKELYEEELEVRTHLHQLLINLETFHSESPIIKSNSYYFLCRYLEI